jgi:hypothetical protein
LAKDSPRGTLSDISLGGGVRIILYPLPVLRFPAEATVVQMAGLVLLASFATGY